MTSLKYIESRILQLWRDVDALTKEAEAKALHLKRLRVDEQVPIMASDYPTRCWVAIGEHHTAIVVLEQMRRDLKMRRRKSPPKRSADRG